MKALTLHQPWASLIALGYKTIETRSWATSHRGPLAIHAGTRRPPLMSLPPRPRGRDTDGWHPWLVIDTITDPAHQRPHRQGERVPKRSQTPTLFYPHAGPHGRPHVKGTPATERDTAIYLPLGAVVATCTLVDCVPTDGRWVSYADDIDPSADDVGCVPAHGGWVRDGEDPEYLYTLSVGQLPFGDFTPGRWAWLLDDVQPTTSRCPGEFLRKHCSCSEPGWCHRQTCSLCRGRGTCDPIPARGRQGVWNWDATSGVESPPPLSSSEPQESA